MLKAIFSFFCLSLICISSLYAESPKTSIDVNLTTSGLYNVTLDRANWITLLNVEMDQQLWKGASLNADLLSVYNLRDSRGLGSISPDLQIFSAIEDETVELSLFMFGLTQKLGSVSLFLGTRNVNQDYFISPWNSIFTGSTNGLLPVISNEYPLSDSPLSALCFHLNWKIISGLRLKNSLYNGIAGRDWIDRFRFNPKQDGILNITEASYEDDNYKGYVGNYHLGYVIGKVPERTGGVKRLHQSFWTLIEQPLFIKDENHRLECVIQGGISPHCECDRYSGMGLVWFGIFSNEDYFGAIANRTWHKEGNETALEITYVISLGNIILQPAYHQVFAARSNQSIFMMKIGFEFLYEH